MAAQLCDQCRVLEIDDSTIGVVKAILGGKVEYLEYRLPGAERPPAAVQLDYLLEDTLPSLPKLEASGSTTSPPCCFCRLLRECILASRPEDTTWEGKLNIRLQYVFREGTLEALRAYWDIPTRAKSCPKSVLFTLEGDEARIKSWLRLAYPNPTREALDEETIELFRANSSRSQQFYPYLKKPGSFWPSRLIEIGGDPSATSLRLVLRDDIKNSSKANHDGGYAALSYCWGSAVHAAKQAKTKSVNLAERKAGIPMSALTPLIRDTVKVCQSLGISYLWVDALCILQDSFPDWEIESMAMAEIYAGASITICPLDAAHCEESFLSRRLDWNMKIPFVSKLRPRVKGSYTLRYAGVEQTPEADDEVHAPIDSLERAVKNSPWMKRGWTYQEMQLSRQVLCFGKSRTWLIGTLNAINEKGGFETPTPSILPTISEELFSNGLSDPHKATHLWMAIVQGYSSRQLTYREDTFPALSGLATIFSTAFKDDYVAGLWRKDLLRQLLWRISQNEIQEQVSLPFRSLEGLLKHLSDPRHCFGPSWSWASRNLAVEYNSETDAPWSSRGEVEEIDAQTKAKGVNPFGAVSMGTVYLRTKTRRINFSNARQYSDATMETSSAWIVQMGDRKVHCDMDWICKKLPSTLSTDAEVALLQSARYWLNDETDTDNQVLGLILYPADKAKNTWVRIGTFMCGGESGVNGMELFDDSRTAELTIV